MSLDLDNLPLYDPITGNQKLSYIWINALSTMIDTLKSYLSQYGIFVPKVTTFQRDEIQSPNEGQMIYNTTILAPQIWQNGSWKTFTTF